MLLSMASRGGAEDDVPPGPWGQLVSEGDPVWQWDEDGETSPLLRDEGTETEVPDYDPFLARPWDIKSLNLFDSEL